MSELPVGWSFCKLSDICDKGQYGWTTKACESGTVKFLRTTDITKGPIDWASVPYCLEEPPSLASYELHPDDIVISRAGSVGFSARITRVPVATVFASYLIRFVPGPGIEPRYLAHFLNSPAYWEQIGAASAGIGMANVNAAKLSSVEIPLAPLSEQARIANKLDSLGRRLDSCRTRLTSVPEILKRLRGAVLEAAVSGRLTKKWRELRGRDLHWKSATLQDVGIVSGGLTKNGRRNGLACRKPYLRVANVYQGRLELDDVAEIGLTPEEWAKTALRAGDLLLVEGNGSLDQIGRVALWEGQISECSHQNHLIRWRSTGVTPRFILYWLMSPRGRTSLMDLASTTTGLHTLSISKVQRVPVQVPPQDEQTEIVRRVKELFSLADALVVQHEAAIHHVERLTPAVLSKAFRGQLIPQDPGDEPARDTLERIKGGQPAVTKNGSRQQTLIAHSRSPRQRSVRAGSER